MKKDTKSFLMSVFGVPALLGGVWGLHDANAIAAPTVELSSETPQAESEEVVLPEPVVTVTTKKPAPKPSTAVPPVNQQVPVEPVIIETPIETPAPAPAPRIVKKSRRTRAS